MPDLNFEGGGSLGKLTASADNASKYRVLLVVEGKGVTPASLEANPSPGGDHVLLNELVGNKGGKATVQLDDFRHDLQEKLDRLPNSTKVESFVVATSSAGLSKAAAGPVFAQAIDIIKIGSQIAPPKKSDSESDLGAEKKWWKRLEETKIADLKPGDVLIKKVYDDDAPVPKGQKVFSAAKGTKYADHLMVYVGNGQIAHAAPEGITRAQVQKNCIVYRPKSAAAAASAVAVANWLIGNKIIYSMYHCVMASVGDRSYGPKAKERAKMIHARKLPSRAMMCSEFACYTFQDNPDDPYIHKDSMRMGPIHVEDYVNSNPDKFMFAGKLLEGVEAPPSTPEQGLQLIADELEQAIVDELNGITDEMKAAAKKAKEEAEKAAQAVADAAKAAAQKAADAAAAAAHAAEDAGKSAYNKLKSLF